MDDLALVMPMAGRGSRFAVAGESVPKPLIIRDGHPFFHWAVQSVLHAVPVRQIVFVVLREHVVRHRIDARILHYHPDATIVTIDTPTTGAAETAAIGIAALHRDGPIAVNDCDHAFRAPALGDLVDTVRADAAGGLVGFASDSPAYAYARLDPIDPARVLGTVEKRCVGPFAIAGCYLFRDAAVFDRALTRYRTDCDYTELFVSGLFDLMCRDGERIAFQPLAEHLAFGTPEELAQLPVRALSMLRDAAA